MQEGRYAIRMAAKLAGLTPYVIRAWEKRYGVVQPSRSDSNRRLYSDEEVEHLRLLRRLTEEDYPIGSIAGMTVEELRALLEAEEHKSHSGAWEGERTASTLRDKLIDCARRLDGVGMERLLVEGSVLLSHRALLEDVVVPLVQEIGRGWQEGSLRIVHEHVASAAVRNLLTNMLFDAQLPEDAPVLVVSTPQGQQHELGALIAANFAAMSGWDVTWLGPDLPATEIAASVREIHAEAVLLSIVYPPDDVHVQQELVQLAELLPAGVEIIVGGRAAAGYGDTILRLGGTLLESFGDLWTTLDRLRENRKNCFP
ncbi:MerR family transcriptional regulator [bacterium]|nr:MerR family transcriptional regulator [bacterium]